MPVVVARHDIDAAIAEEHAARAAAELGDSIARVARNKPKALRSVLVYSLMETAGRCVADPGAESAETWGPVVSAMQAASAQFALATATEGEVEIRLADQVFTVSPTGPTYQTDVGAWLRALYLAMICRERGRIDRLAAVSIDDVLRASGARYDEYAYSWVRAWQTYWREEDGLVDSVLNAMRGTDPEALSTADEDVVLHLLYPPIELFYLLTQRQDDRFNASLANALELHKRFWGRDDERRGDPDGYIAWALLAVACLARDAGVVVEVESEYLPRHLLEGTWVGEQVT
ncbi:immunity 49 family protein [Umezawaea beigongshangensis]|uniref:immunity 49 family protein n=1 Tax=Umezawaea beigongshangensis TaxID=2780383 RepID=UPI0018F23BD7|nr:immunity 49 family protein [Umezawaea beigongshangensis]